MGRMYLEPAPLILVTYSIGIPSRLSGWTSDCRTIDYPYSCVAVPGIGA